MNSVYILRAICIVSTLLMAGFAFLWHHEVRAREIVEHTLGNALAENIALTGEIEDVRMARDEARTQRDKLNRENATLHTVLEKVQVATPIPVRPVRKPAKKEGASE